MSYTMKFLNLTMKLLMKMLKKQDVKTIKKLEKTIETLKAVITDLKSSKIKNSSNSSKPSSTNGFKKVIQNNREKSNKLKGGQIGRKGKNLKTVEKPTMVMIFVNVGVKLYILVNI